MVDDVRYAIRSLISTRGFSVVAFLVIALSVGAIAPIFSIVDAALLRPLPYPDPARLAIVRDIDIPAAQAGRLPMSQRNYLDWRERQQGFEAVAAIRGNSVLFDAAGGEQEGNIARVTGDFFSVVRQTPITGRLLTRDDEANDRRVAVISNGLWKRLFAGRQDVIGQMLRVGPTAYEVVGVTRQDFAFPAGSLRPYDAFVPLVVPPAERLRPRGQPFLTALGRLRQDVTLGQAQAAMDGVAAALQREHPDWDPRVVVQPYHEYVTGRAANWMTLLLWGVALVFLIMCANVANLLLARGGARRREVGVRAALGASRARIARQLVIESLLLAVAGTAAGLVIGWWMLDVLRAAIPAGIPRVSEIALDWRIVGIAGAAALITGGTFGLAPAILSTRVDLSSALKSGPAAGTPAASSRLRNLLIVGEVGVALVLLVGALLFVTSFLKVTSIPLGVDYQNVVIAPLQLRPPESGIVRITEDFWARQDRVHDLADRIVERVRAVPGVEDVAAASGFPFAGGSTRFSYELPGRPGFKWTRGQHDMVAMKMVSPNYLEMLKIPLIRGRYLRASDTREAEGAIVLSETAARMIWPGEDPIGQEIDLQKRLRVVGVVADVRMGGPEMEPWPDVYVPMLQGRGTMVQALLVRTRLPAEELLPSLRTAMQSVDQSQKVWEVATLEARLASMLAQRRFNMLVAMSFGAIGVLIAAIGLYGVMAYLVSQRRHEIGVRMALGASRARVVRLVLSRAALLVAAGLVGGGLGVWQFASAARAFLFQLDPLDGWVIASAAALVALTALAASVIPARRAASIDPLVALRQD